MGVCVCVCVMSLFYIECATPHTRWRWWWRWCWRWLSIQWFTDEWWQSLTRMNFGVADRAHRLWYSHTSERDAYARLADVCDDCVFARADGYMDLDIHGMFELQFRNERTHYLSDDELHTYGFRSMQSINQRKFGRWYVTRITADTS